MKRLVSWFNILLKQRRELRRWQRIVTVLAAVMTFVTTYALILPAITVERDKTGDVGGMYLEQAADQDAMLEDNALEPTDVSLDADQENDAAKPDDDGDETTAAPTVGTLEYPGGDYNVILTYDETSGIPEGASLEVSEITADTDEYQMYLDEAKKAMGLTEEESLPRYAARFFDIKIMADEQEFTPKSGVSVEITYAEPLAEDPDREVNAVHFADETAEGEVIEANMSEIREDGSATVEFMAESFSVYGVIYTVDFAYEVDGKTYEFSMPGGGFVSLSNLVEVLGLGKTSTNSSDTSNKGKSNSAYEQENFLTNAQVSEATKKFMSKVANVEFSSPELLRVEKVDSKGTDVWDIIKSNNLSPIVSADIDWNQLDESYSRELETGDWILLSLAAFNSHEKLTITLKNGETYQIPVTDAQRTLGGVEPRGDSSGKSASQLTNNNTTLPDAKASKVLTPNDDGTYTLSLSMEVPNIAAQKSSHANVVIIYDSSNSMHYDVPGNEWVRDDEHGTYAEYNGKYYQLNSFGTDVRKVFSFVDEDGATHSFGFDEKNKGTFCGPKYSPTKTRMDVAESCVKSLVQTLLDKNTVSDPNAIEIGFVEFASDIMQVQQPTTDLDTINGWVDACHTWVKDNQNAGDLRGGTNWDAALRIAGGRTYEGHSEVVQFSDDDQKYIIFISDGNPTARTTPDGLVEDYPNDSSDVYDDGSRIGASGLYGSITPGVYGTGISDIKGYNYDRAQDQANQIVNTDGTYLYTVGIFGDADKMSGLTNSGYYDGTDEEGIRAAFSSIIGQISSRMGYSSLSILDGITSMTSTTLSGNPQDFIYKVTKKDSEGNVIDVTDQVWSDGIPEDKKAVYHTSTEPNESGYITWNLGADEILLPGGTYSVSFIVWPEQDAYDLVAGLNNGEKEWGDLTSEEKAQVVGSGENGDQAPYSLKTNTRQKVDYRKVTEETDESGNITTHYEDKQAPLETPDPMPLTDTIVSVQKEWKVSLSPEELSEFLSNHPGYKVQLTLKKDTESGPVDYISGIEIDPVSETLIWPEMNDNDEAAVHHISTGLMVSAAKGIASGLFEDADENGVPDDNKGYAARKFGGKTYYILENGWDYYFEEAAESDYHFELEKQVYHPMVVDDVEMDVTFNEDGTIASMKEFSTSLTAVNSLKGGINIEKKIVNKNGEVIESQDKTTEFIIHGSVTREVETSDGTKTEGTALEYRLIGDEYIDEFNKPGRTPKRYIADSKVFELPIHAGDLIRIINVPSGYSYTFYEELSSGSNAYSFHSIEGTITAKDENGQDIPVADSNITVTPDGTLMGTSMSNVAQNIVVKNTFDETAPPPTPVNPEATVIANKRIDYLGDGGNDSSDLNKGGTDAYTKDDNAKNDLYRLYLDATMKKYISGANIIIVEDYSTSMTTNGGYTGMQKALIGNNKDGLVYDLLREGNDNEMMLIKFSDINNHPLQSGGSTNGSGVLVDWTTDPEDIYKEVSKGFPTPTNINFDNGDHSYWTDYTRALQLIDQNLPNNGKPTYVVFMSDGVPTVYMEGSNEVGGWEKRSGFPYYAHRWSVDGKTVPENLNVVVPATEAAIKEFARNHQDLNVMTVGYGEAAEGKTISQINLQPSLINEPLRVGNINTNHLLKLLGRSGYYSANNETELEEALSSALTLKPITAIEIQDTLSEYVDLYAKEPDFTVTKASKGGTPQNLTVRNDLTVYDGSKKIGQIVQEGKTISLIFETDLKYDDGDTYVLAFNVEASTKAYEEYSENKRNDDPTGYGTSVGEEKTDYGHNLTSVGQYGFPSNDSAKVTYKYGEEEKTEDYPKPVIQVGSTKLALEKKWVDKNENTIAAPVNEVTVRLYANVPDNDGNGSTRETVGDYTLKKSQGWKVTINDLAPKALIHAGESSSEYRPIVYTVEELNVLEGYRIQIQFDKTESADSSSFSNMTNRYEAVGQHIYYIGQAAESGHGTITNIYEPVELTIKKNWNLDDANTNTALQNSKVTVTIGRYILMDKAGTLTISKTGVPAGAVFDAVYTVTGDNGKSYGPYTYAEVAGNSGLSIPVAPGKYTVTEDIREQDSTITWNHSSNTVSNIEIADGGNGAAQFTCTPAVKTGSIRITSTVDKGGSDVDFSGVTYTLYEKDGDNLKTAYYADGTPVSVVSYSEARVGKTLSNLKTGNYVVVESDVPSVDGYVVTEHVPENSSKIDVEVKEQDEPANADFYTKYEEDNVFHTLTIRHDPSMAGPDPKTFSYKKGTEVTITFDYSGDTWMNGMYKNIGITVNRQDKGLIFNQPNHKKTVEVTILGDTDVILTNVGYSEWSNVTNVMQLDPPDQNNNFKASRRLLGNGSVMKAVSPGNTAPTPSTYGNVPEPADSMKKYIDDVTFTDPADSTKPYTVELTQAKSWQDTIQGLPLTDGQGNNYYYYIKTVTEENMPEGTSCSVKLDGVNKFIVGEDIHTGDSLEVSNEVTEVEPVKASIKVIKVVEGESAPYTRLAGAVFTLTKVDEDGHEPADESEQYSSGIQNVDANGELTFTELTPGRYLLEESKTPDGYILKEGPYYITIDSEGRASCEGGNSFTMIHELTDNEFTIENEPGAALPSTGGPGTRLFTILGSILILGAGVLLWRRRRLI